MYFIKTDFPKLGHKLAMTFNTKMITNKYFLQVKKKQKYIIIINMYIRCLVATSLKFVNILSVQSYIPLFFGSYSLLNPCICNCAVPNKDSQPIL